MKKSLSLFLFFVSALLHAQTNQWTWVSGDDAINQYGVYGIKGVADPANKPGGRYGSVSWKDASGNLWLFGGTGYANSGAEGKLNDLWKYDTTHKVWTWMNGDSSINQSSVYGTEGIEDINSKPGGREMPLGWTDGSGNFWMFGGRGYAIGPPGELGDLWKYDLGTNKWTWVNGDNTASNNGVYGNKGV